MVCCLSRDFAFAFEQIILFEAYVANIDHLGMHFFIIDYLVKCFERLLILKTLVKRNENFGNILNKVKRLREVVYLYINEEDKDFLLNFKGSDRATLVPWGQWPPNFFII